MPGLIQENYLEAALKGSADLVYERLEDFLDEGTETPQTCNKFVLDGLSELIHQALEAPRAHLLQLQVLLRIVQQLASFPEQQNGLDFLIDGGLASLMSECLVTSLHGIRDSDEDNVFKFYEDTLETITVISDYSQKAKKLMIETFCSRMLQIVAHVNFRPQVKIEAIKSVNSLMDECTPETRDTLYAKVDHQQQVHKVGMLLSRAGDYEFQAGIVEGLFRLTSKVVRMKHVATWLEEDESLQRCLLSIRDSNFEADCRSFLNIMNKRLKSTPRVVSLPCISAALEDYPLEKPEEETYTEFWVDFNGGSQRVSLFCKQQPNEDQDGEEDETLWETVSVWRDNVYSFDVTAEKKGIQNVCLLLESDAKDLVRFGPDFHGNRVTFRFNAEYDVTEALIMTLGVDKCARNVQESESMPMNSQMSVDTCAGANNKISQAQQPVHVSSEQDALDQKRAQLRKQQRSSAGSQKTNNGEQTNERSQFKQPPPPPSVHNSKIPCSQESGGSTPVRNAPRIEVQTTPKCSVPQEPMRTPAITISSQSPKQNTSTNKSVPPKPEVKGRTPHKTRLNGNNTQKAAITPQPSQKATTLQPSEDSTMDDDVDTIPGSQQGVVSGPRHSGRRRRKVSRSIQYNRNVTNNVPPVADVPEIIPSSCPAEDEVIPDSQLCAHVPEVTTRGNPRAPETRVEEPRAPQVTSPEKKPGKPKQQRKEEIAALKDKLVSTDPHYTKYPLNTHKVSNTPALSTVSEESGDSHRPTPRSTTNITAIAEVEEEEVIADSKSPGKLSPMCGVKPGARAAVMSPDSTCHPPDPPPKGRGKGAKGQIQKKKTVKDTEQPEETSPESKKPPTRSSRSRKTKQQSGQVEETICSPTSIRSTPNSEEDGNMAHVVTALHGLDYDDSDPISPVPCAEQVAPSLKENTKKTRKGQNKKKSPPPSKTKPTEEQSEDEDEITVIPASLEPTAPVKEKRTSPAEAKKEQKKSPPKKRDKSKEKGVAKEQQEGEETRGRNKENSVAMEHKEVQKETGEKTGRNKSKERITVQDEMKEANAPTQTPGKNNNKNASRKQEKRMGTPRHELEKMKEKISASQSQEEGVTQTGDPYTFSDTEGSEGEPRPPSPEIHVTKFYKAEGGKKKQALQTSAASSRTPGRGDPHPQGLPPGNRPSAKTIGKTGAPKARKSSEINEDDFPDLIVEKDSFSEYREREYKFFKSRNSSIVGASNKTPKATTTTIGATATTTTIGATATRTPKSRPGSGGRAPLTFTSPLAGESKVSANNKNNKKKGKQSKEESKKAVKERQARGKKKTTAPPPVEIEPAPPVSPPPASPEVHVTRLDSRKSPIQSPVRLSNINLAESPELAALVAELEKGGKGKAKAAAVKNKKTDKMKEVSKKKQADRISQAMEKIRQQVLEDTENAAAKPGVRNKKNSRLQKNAEIEAEIEDSDDQNNAPMETENDADVSTNLADESVNSFASACKNLVKKAAGHSLRVRKNVTYTEISENEIYHDQSSFNETQQSGPKLDMHPKPQVEKKRKKHRSVFSETDDAVSGRSEVSWLASTARKKKPPPAKSYISRSPRQGGGHPFVRRKDPPEDDSSESEEEMDEGYEPTQEQPKPLPADRKKKRKMLKSPQETDEEEKGDAEENMYYEPGKKRKPRVQPREANKENIPPETTELPVEAERPVYKTPVAEKPNKRRKQRPQKPVSVTSDEEQEPDAPSGVELTQEVTSRLQRILKQTSGPENKTRVALKLTSGNVMRGATATSGVAAPAPATKTRDVINDRISSSSVLDDAIEQFRHDITTMGPLGDISPITVDGEELMLTQKSLGDEFDARSQFSCASHISSLKTPKTPARRDHFQIDDDEDEVVSQKSVKSGKSVKSVASNKSAKPKARPGAAEKRSRSLGPEIDEEDSGASGPSKRRRVMKVVPVEDDDLRLSGLVAETGQDDQDQEEDEVASQSSSQQLQPRRLFTPQERERLKQQKQRKQQQGSPALDTDSTCSEEAAMMSPVSSGLELPVPALDTVGVELGEVDETLAGNVSLLLNSFSSEIQKNMLARRQQLQHLTKGVMKNTHDELMSFWSQQTSIREKMLQDFRSALVSELSALEKDHDNLQTAEEKAMEFFVSQFKVIQTNLASQKKRLGNLQRIQMAFSDDLIDLEHSQYLQQNKARDILKKNNKDLQKKILLTTQQQEISNVKRTLQSLFM